MAGRIEDYAVVGDMQSVALVSADGSVDWLCLPRFDSEACFAALLGTRDHGCWQIAPSGRSTASRRYAGETLILQTRWETATGVAEVTDFMPPREDGEPPVLIRLVQGVSGTVDMGVRLTLRFGYGSIIRSGCAPEPERGGSCSTATSRRPRPGGSGWAVRSPGTRRTSRSCTAWPGSAWLAEWEASWLPGYENSSPVRIGNAAADQLQLDVYGEVIDALQLSCKSGLHDDRHTWSLQRALLEFLERHWAEPDEGLWEVRGPRRHFVHSKVMAWVAFDRAATYADDAGETELAAKWRGIRDEINREVCEKGYDSARGAFVQYYGASELDAAVLLIPDVGFLPADDPRVVSTMKVLQRDLMRDGFLRRYELPPGGTSEVDGLAGSEGAFLACSFWLANALELSGRHEEAVELFERLLALRNDVGLLSEEYDPRYGRLVGNMPQAFSHVPLVQTALNLEGHAQEHRRGPWDERRSVPG